jgi:hypothetical protein
MRTLDFRSLYCFGRVAMTANARATLEDGDLAVAILRHLRSLPAHRENRNATQNAARLLGGCRILSVHRAGSGTPFWLITEADGTLAILLPEDY